MECENNVPGRKIGKCGTGDGENEDKRVGSVRGQMKRGGTD